MSKENFHREEACRPTSGCILKIKTNGRSFRGLIDYQAERGTNMSGFVTQLPIFTNMLGRTPRELAREMAVVRRLRPRLNNAIGHLQICPSQALKTREEWVKAVEIAFREHDISNAPFVCYLHSEGDGKTNHSHMHIAFSRIRYDGSVISDSKSYRKNEAAAREIERALALGIIQEQPREMRPYNSRKAFDSLRREDRYKEDSREKPNGYVSAKKSSKGPKKMSTKENIGKMVSAVERAMRGAMSEVEFKEKLERDLEEQGIARQVKFARRGAENEIYGFSLVADLGSGGIANVKGSELGRHLSWTRVADQIAENLNRARRARMQLASEDADAMVATSAAIVRSAKAPVPTAAVAGVASIQAGTSARIQPTPLMSGANAKPELSLLQGQGVRITDYEASRLNGFDADASDASVWEYRRVGTDEVCFVDLGGSLEIHDDALENRGDVDAFLRTAKARFGSRLTLLDAPQKGEFLELLAEAARKHDVEVIDGRTGLPVGAAQQHKEPVATDEHGQALGELGKHYDEEVAQLDALGLGIGHRAVQDPVARAVLEALKSVEVRVVEEGDLAGRRAAAARVKAMAEGLPPVPTPTVAAAMDSPSLRALHEAFARMLPVREWAEVTSSRMEKGSFLARGDALALVQRVQEREASWRGKPLQTELTRDAEAKARSELVAARKGMENLSLLERGAEAVTGTRSKDIARLEGEMQRRASETLAAQRRFQKQLESDEEGRAALAQMQERIDTYWAEWGAMHAPWVQHLAARLSGLLAEIWGWVTGAQRKEQNDAQQVRDLQQMIEEAHEAAAVRGGFVLGDDQERAQVRRDLGRGG